MTSEPSAAAADEELIEALVRNAFEVMGIFTRIGAEHDLSLTQLRVMGILRDRRPRMTELAAYLGLDKSSMSGLIDRAERRGLMARGKDPDDKRAVDVYLTPAGRELMQRLYDEFVLELAPMTGNLTARQRAELTRLLKIVLADRPSGARRSG